MNFAPRGIRSTKGTKDKARHKKDACTSNAQGGRRIARRKIAQREAVVMMMGWRWGEEERRGKKVRGRRIGPAGMGGK